MLVFVLMTISSDMQRPGGLLKTLQDYAQFKYAYYEITCIIAFFCYSLFSYLALWIFYPKNKKILAFALVILAIPLATGVRYFLQEFISQEIWGFRNYREGTSFVTYFMSNMYYVFIYVSVGIAYFFTQRSKHQEKMRNDLIIESKKTELSFLRSQVNPHFLFNSLNNIYSLVNQKSDRSLIAIDTLSHLLRYSLYEINKKVPLSSEIEAIDHYLSLENLRVANGIQIQKMLPAQAENIFIEPLLLLPFIENAIKHGDINNSAHPIQLKIQQDENSNDLEFSISNRKKVKQKDKVGGIGLENVKKRLKLLYPEQHTLNIDNQNDNFSIHLIIQG